PLDPDHRADLVRFDNLRVIIVKQPIRASLFQANQDGTFRYLPLPGFQGLDEFAFKVNDGYRDSNVATVRITVDNDPLHPHGPEGLNAAEVQVPVPVPGHGTPEEGVGLVDPEDSSQITDFQPV